jgi:hypothetical protein
MAAAKSLSEEREIQFMNELCRFNSNISDENEN